MLIIAGTLLVILTLNAIFTWGITFYRDGGFFWSTTSLFEDIVTDGYADVRLGDGQNDPIFAIPFVFWFYGIESPPYAINLSIRDDTGLLEKFYLESVIIEYVDGQKTEHNVDWERDFGNKFSEMPEKYAIDKLPVTVDKRESCKIRFVGYFVNKEKVKIPFDTIKDFEYEPYKWKISPVRGSF